MRHFFLWMAMLGVALASARCAGPAAPRVEQAQAVAELQKLGGKITVAEKEPGTPVTAVNLSDVAITDATLANLEGLPHLQKLDLGHTNKLGHATITDAGLAHVAGLSDLRRLSLTNTDVSDAGLEHLRRLSSLESLNLEGTKVTDAGLKSLKGLSKLQTLKLRRTAVTGAGVKTLQESLPRCKITFQ